MPAVRNVRPHTEQVDQEMQWLAREAPQFHSQVPLDPLLSSSGSAQKDDGDDSPSSGTDSDASGSDDEEDPYHPYNVVDPSVKWIRAGDFVYAADDLQGSYLSGNHQHVVDDAPYVPPAVPGQNKAWVPPFLGPNDLAPSSPYIEPYVFNEQESQYSQQAVSPLDIAKPLPSTSASVSGTRTRNAPRAGPSRRTTTRTSSRGYAVKDAPSDDEAQFSSEDDASEDEYVPSPRVRTRRLPGSSSSSSLRKIGRPSPRYSHSPYPSSSSSVRSPSTPDSTQSSASGRTRPGSRNLQIFDQAPPPRGNWSKTGPDAYRCPYCGHFQQNKRSPDMERHIRSHFRSAVQAQWVCCGVPVEEAAAYNIGPGHNPQMFNGQLMVGGCHEDFSRMDALKRHWKNKNNSCVGDIRYARAGDD